MKKFLFLLSIAHFLASCHCDEDALLVPADEIVPEDNFFVTYAAYEEDSAGQFIYIEFNRLLNRETVQLDETFLLEGDGLEVEYYSVGPNYIELECGNHFWCQNDSCIISLRLTSGIESTDGTALDGDRDGKPGGNFMEQLTASRCPFDPILFEVLNPSADEALLEGFTNDTITIPVEFSLPVDTFKFFPGDNIALFCENGDGQIPISWQWDEASVRKGTVSFQVGMLWEMCGIGPNERGQIYLAITGETLSQSGLMLDGDGDRTAGGDFKKTYNFNHLLPPLLQLADPDPEDEIISLPDTGALQIRLTFTEDVDLNNFTPSQQIEITCQGTSTTVPFSFSWEDGSARAGTISIEPGVLINTCFRDLTTGRINFTLRVRGSTRSQAGSFLDGDGDGDPGGDFLKNYSAGN